jgi:hypothetical protein
MKALSFFLGVIFVGETRPPEPGDEGGLLRPEVNLSLILDRSSATFEN